MKVNSIVVVVLSIRLKKKKICTASDNKCLYVIVTTKSVRKPELREFPFR